MKRAKYTGYIIKVENVTIDTATGNICTPTSTEKLLDAIGGDKQKYLLVTLMSNMGTVTGNTLKELNNNAWALAEKEVLSYDFELFINK